MRKRSLICFSDASPPVCEPVILGALPCKKGILEHKGTFRLSHRAISVSGWEQSDRGLRRGQSQFTRLENTINIRHPQPKTVVAITVRG